LKRGIYPYEDTWHLRHKMFHECGTMQCRNPSQLHNTLGDIRQLKVYWKNKVNELNQ